ncbi:hypothetical protein BH10PSE9_BH10PSE9_09040 [soil metagenome]
MFLLIAAGKLAGWGRQMWRSALRQLGCVALGLGLIAASPASAVVTFCNDFQHAIWVAIAYPQKDGSFLSRGWLALDPQHCGPFDTALKLNALYYRAESVTYKDAKGKKVRYSWGKDRKFALWEDDNFNYWGAEAKVLNSRLELFSAGTTTDDEDGLDITLTFKEGSVITTLNATQTRPSGKSSGPEH